VPRKAKAFYATIAIGTISGALLNFMPVSPIKALYWSAVVNGLVAVPVMIIMMLLSRDTRVMGRFGISLTLRAVGWIATLVMGAAAGVLVLTTFLK
jgi:Mn2+/Fe2+ NRAMP family transporter